MGNGHTETEMRLQWECLNQSQETNWRHCVTGLELPFFHERKSIRETDQCVRMLWRTLSMRVAYSYSSAPAWQHFPPRLCFAGAILAIIFVAWMLALLAGSMMEFLTLKAKKYYGIIVTVTFFFLPLVIILAAYGTIFHIARAHARGRGVSSFKKVMWFVTWLRVVSNFGESEIHARHDTWRTLDAKGACPTRDNCISPTVNC